MNELLDKWENRSPGYDCKICGDKANNDVRLFGRYNTRLCIDHLNELVEYSIEHSLERTLHDLEWKRQALVYAQRGEHFTSNFDHACQAVTDYKDNLYHVTKSWVMMKRKEHMKQMGEG